MKKIIYCNHSFTDLWFSRQNNSNYQRFHETDPLNYPSNQRGLCPLWTPFTQNNLWKRTLVVDQIRKYHVRYIQTTLTADAPPWSHNISFVIVCDRQIKKNNKQKKLRFFRVVLLLGSFSLKGYDVKICCRVVFPGVRCVPPGYSFLPFLLIFIFVSSLSCTPSHHYW